MYIWIRNSIFKVGYLQFHVKIVYSFYTIIFNEYLTFQILYLHK